MIAVIDSGVPKSLHSSLPLHKALYVDEDNRVLEDNSEDISLHGYYVCEIIHKGAPSAEILSIRIFDRNLKTSLSKLVTALGYCSLHKVPLINLSLGSHELTDKSKLEVVISDLVDQGSVLVSAQSNSRGLSLPAMHPYVYSVRCSLDKKNGTGNVPWSRESFWPPLENETGYLNLMAKATSFACPREAARLYSLLISKDKGINSCTENKCDFSLAELPTFIRDPLIWSSEKCDDKELIESLKLDVEYDKNSINSCKKKSIIYVPSKDRLTDLNNIFFLDKLKTVENVFYLGSWHPIFELLSSISIKNIYFLPTEKNYPFEIKENKLSALRILCKGEPKYVFSMMAKLNENFIKKGFSCLTMSDNPLATLFGHIYFPFPEKSYRRKQLEYAFEPEIELIFSSQEVQRDAEIIIQCKKRKFMYILVINSTHTFCANLDELVQCIEQLWD